MPVYDPFLIADFGTEECRFRLGLAEVELVQTASGTGIFDLPRVLAGMVPGKPGIHDVRAPILYGLIGGGMKDLEALNLVRRVFDPGRGSPFRYAELAARIVDVTLDPPEAVKNSASGAEPASVPEPTTEPST